MQDAEHPTFDANLLPPPVTILVDSSLETPRPTKHPNLERLKVRLVPASRIDYLDLIQSRKLCDAQLKKFLSQGINSSRDLVDSVAQERPYDYRELH
jgi:hypothetical protein